MNVRSGVKPDSGGMTMNTQSRNLMQSSAVVLAVLLLSVPVRAAEADEVSELSRPESLITFGAGVISDDNQRFGQYTGMNEEGAYGLLDISIANRDDETGTWVLLEGRNLGLDNRDLRFEHRRQGDWGYFLEYSQIPRIEPFTPTTAVTGIGTPNLNIPAIATTGTPVELKTTRDVFGFGLDKAFADKIDVQVRYQQQEKNGERLFARGTTGGTGVFQFMPEPIDSTTRMLETTVSYTDKKLQLSGGYYGTLYENHNNALNVTEVGGATNLATFTPIGLPPDNMAHQLFVAGGYSFTPTTRATFKAAYAHATQEDTFILPAITGQSNLGGEVDTTLLQAGITARPLPKLSVLANLRHENRDDKTPVLDYTAGTGSTYTGENEPRSIKTNAAKLEATYSLPLALRVTGGVDYDMKERNTSDVRAVSARLETDELSYRLALRRSISETLTGSLGVIHSQRDGSPFLTTVQSSGAVGSNLIAPIHYSDRERDKVRLSLNWMPIELLSIQLMADSARDEYSARTAENLGPREGTAENYAVDATLVFSDAWQLTAWASRNKNRIDQAACEAASALGGVCPNTVADPFWEVSLRNLGSSGGLGLRAKPVGKLQLGVDLQYSVLNDEYSQVATTPGAVAPMIPDIETRITAIRLFAKYALMKSAGIRFDYAFQRWTSDDWTWSSWTYTDGTQLTQQPVQKVHFFGVSGYYHWQ